MSSTERAYHDVSLDWLPKVPSGWRVLPNVRIFSLRRETGYPDLPILEVSIETGVTIRDMTSNERKQTMSDMALYQRAVEGDIAYNTMRMWQGAVGVAPVNGLVSPAYVVVQPRPGVCARYFAYLFRTPVYLNEINRASHGIVMDRNRLYWDQFKQMPSIVPPLSEQDSIVTFLDRKEREIAEYIATKQRMIEVLALHKIVQMRRIMLSGIDGDAPVRSSGVEWLGTVPVQWKTSRLKWVARLQRGYDLPADQRQEGRVPVYSSGGLIGTHSESRARGPGVVMGRYGSTDAVFYVEEDYWPHNTSLFVTDFQSNYPKWCFHLLRTISKAEHAAKSAVPGVDRKDLYEIVVPCPPVEEQRRLVAALEAAEDSTDEAIATLEREIAVMQEYRTRLIADVVTGQIDVRRLG